MCRDAYKRRLNTYLADIDKQAQERFGRLIEDMKQAQGITEQLKAENALEWVGRMNNIQACAMEIVNEEIIYAWYIDGREKSLLSVFLQKDCKLRFSSVFCVTH